MESIRKTRRKKEGEKEKKAGRPPIEEQLFLSSEMEDFCQLVRAGFSLDEISDNLNLPVEKLMRFQENSLVQARIRNLTGDRLPIVTQLQDELYESALKAAIKQFKDVDNRGVPTALFNDLWKVITRFDPFRTDAETIKKLSSETTSNKETVNEVTETALTDKGSIFTKKVELTEHVIPNKDR